MIYKKTKAELRNQEQPFDMGKKKKRNKNVPAVVWYPTRVIEFLGRRTPIILKEKDTRCSLVAICNVLLLGEKITLDLDIKKVLESHLIHLFQRPLLCGNTQMQLEQNLELSEFNKQVLGVLPKLTCSLYFDVTFSSSCGLEKTFETALFGFLGVPLRHGWLVDPQDAELDSSIRGSSYSKLSYNLAIYESIRPKTNSGPQKHGRYEDDMFYSALAFSKTGSEKELDSTSCATISTFLQGPQLTRYGFSSLHNDLRALQPTVLIWNENLITISKFEDKIYVLLNDLSLLRTETDAVWERLTQFLAHGLVGHARH
ncbi:Alanine--tRNA ligase [Zea mays]|uniref:Alanine--tRNA ligase n=1 Tax=Zea mays TaxID=4577 RepID=A0A1D6KHJ1_MAIZE|nr:Alanine--tRNA ligase [Zea mays]ONM02481.1 Alanine--tRNA ligase [Zea mays]